MAVSYGGQAVLEGVMMRSASNWAVAVRTPEGDITEVVQEITSPMSKRKLWRLPIVRGVIALGESLAIGFRALAISANVATQETDEDGEIKTVITRGQILFSFAIAIVFALMLFKVGPALLTSWLPIDSTPAFVVVEGLIRVTVLIAYLLLISLLPDLRRVFQYHGAEHKTIAAYEHGVELVPDQVDRYPKEHVRCGTNFLIIVMVITIFVFTLFGTPGFLWRIGSRILAIPIIAGFAYEALRLGARFHGSLVMRALMAPGIWLQKITTQQPDHTQIEVAIASFDEVLRREEEAADAAG